VQRTVCCNDLRFWCASKIATNYTEFIKNRLERGKWLKTHCYAVTTKSNFLKEMHSKRCQLENYSMWHTALWHNVTLWHQSDMKVSAFVGTKRTDEGTVGAPTCLLGNRDSNSWLLDSNLLALTQNWQKDSCLFRIVHADIFQSVRAVCLNRCLLLTVHSVWLLLFF
jgi:hypothetical protein